jgi:hypothetical protein
LLNQRWLGRIAESTLLHYGQLWSYKASDGLIDHGIGASTSIPRATPIGLIQNPKARIPICSAIWRQILADIQSDLVLYVFPSNNDQWYHPRYNPS